MKTSIAIVLVAIVAFAAGAWVGRSPAPDAETAELLARIEGSLEELTKLAARTAAAPAAPAAPRRRGPDPNKVYEVSVDGAPARGPAEAPVTIVEFSDFQCPYCSRVGPTLAALRAQYPSQVRIVYKHLPLSFHRSALPAAKASVAAQRQGKFWEMHDLLFANQKKLDEATFKGHAEALGLDLARFEADLKSSEVAALVAKDQAEARALGVTGTPGFFVNGRFLSGAKPVSSFQKLIDAELEKPKS